MMVPKEGTDQTSIHSRLKPTATSGMKTHKPAYTCLHFIQNSIRSAPCELQRCRVDEKVERQECLHELGDCLLVGHDNLIVPHIVPIQGLVLATRYRHADLRDRRGQDAPHQRNVKRQGWILRRGQRERNRCLSGCQVGCVRRPLGQIPSAPNRLQKGRHLDIPNLVPQLAQGWHGTHVALLVHLAIVRRSIHLGDINA